MKRLSTSELRKDVSDAISRVAYSGERIVLQRHHKDVAAIVPLDDLARLRAFEDEADRRAVARSKKHRGKNVSWEDLKKESGL